MAFASSSILFADVAELFEALAKLAPKRAGQPRKSSGRAEGVSKQLEVVQNWIGHVKKLYPSGGRGELGSLPQGTVCIFLRLLFPEEGPRRRYGMQETILANHLSTLFIGKEGLFRNWNAPSLEQRATSSGCLGTEIAAWMDRTGRGRQADAESTLTIGRVDELLDELAAKCPFSAREVRDSVHLPRPSRPTSAILANLFNRLNPFETSMMVQLLLRDISPVIYPSPSLSGGAALREFNSTAYARLEAYEVLGAWHPAGETHYRVVKDLDYVGRIMEEALRGGQDPPKPAPVHGIPIQVPKSNRPGTCVVACRHLRGRVAVETKYDGERLQIHIDLTQPLNEQIRIFSKSTRESTNERRPLINIIRAALGLPLSPYERLDSRLVARVAALRTSPAPYPSRLIIEGEMVPYDENKGGIDEFWKLGAAKGGADIPLSPGRKESQSSCVTGDTTSPDRQSKPGYKESPLHLKIVWFDLLRVEDEVLLHTPFEERRVRLASLVQEIEGYSKLVDSIDIDFSSSSALSDLRLRFAHVITMRCEGLMLKPLNSAYNDRRSTMKWVKLKKDFIPGAGDTLDFHIVGASWNKRRGRQLLVPPSMYTTFFVGLRADDLGARFSKFAKPHYHILFSTSYGLDRRQLGQLDASIREKDPLRFEFEGTTFQKCASPRGSLTVFESPCTTFTFSLAGHLVSANERPSIIFKAPRVFELNGAGFQRSPSSPYYELRWPCITKVDREDGEPLSLAVLQETAREAMRLISTNESQSIVQLLWSKIAAVQAPETAQQRYDRELPEWLARLEKADKVGAEDSLLKELPVVLRLEAPQVSASSSLIVTPLGKGMDDAPEEDGVEDHRQAHSSPLKPEKTVLHVDIDLTTSPSPSPLRARTHRPPLSPTTPPAQASASLLAPATTASLALQQRLNKRPRVSCPSLLPSRPPTPAPSSDLEPPPFKCPRRRRSLPATSASTVWNSLSSSLSAPLPLITPAAPKAFAAFAWAVLSAPSSSTQANPRPRHPSLVAENYFRNPLDVLWCAGWSVDRLTAYAGVRRRGYVFVEGGEADVEWLERQKGQKGAGEMASVWIVDRAACERMGEWDMEGLLSVL